jgi:hypothetical protein
VTDITAREFDVTENGVKREIVRVSVGTPMRIILLVDSSTTVAPLLTTMRRGLTAFLDAMPPTQEMALITTGGQIGIRVPPTSDRAKLGAAATGFAAQGGANAFLETLLEADRRFLKNTPASWPVFVMVVTDSNSRQESAIDQFNGFVDDFTARGGNAHAIVISDGKNGVVTDLARNLVQNTGGVFDTMTIANTLPDKMQAIAARLVAAQQAMSGRYELEYRGDAKAGPVSVAVARDGVALRLSPRRPF